jgi:hypothetical protein
LQAQSLAALTLDFNPTSGCAPPGKVLTVHQNPVSISSHENKNDWIAPGVLFFGRSSMLGR